MNLISKFLERTEYKDYEDFYKNARIVVPENFNFAFDVIDEYARLCPDKRAIVWCNSKGEEKFFSFKDVSEMSNQIANYFLKLGLKRGDYIMTMLNRRWEYWMTIIACHKIGITIIPATHLLTSKDIYFRLNSAEAKLLIATAEEDVIEHINSALDKCTTLIKCLYTEPVEGFEHFDELFAKESKELNIDYKPCGDENLMCYFTSGTTGMPKMVQHDYNYPLGHIFTAYYWQKVVDDGLHLTMAETGWAKCSWGRLYGQWICGTALFIYDYNGRFTPTDILPFIQKYGITTFCAPPTIYRFFIKEDLSSYDFSSLVHCSTAGEALNPEVYRQFLSATGQKIYEGFGQTESTLILGNFADFGEPIQGSLGKPSPVYDVVLIDDDENVIGNNQEGEIAIRLTEDQIGLVTNYKNDPERTLQARGGVFYHTGDLATRDDNGVYWYVGRKDDIIKSSGYRIGPYEVESALMEHPSVLECAITGVPDPLRGQVVKATVVLAKGYTPSDELIKELQMFVKKLTAPYKYPRIIEFVDEMPKTISGKIKRVDIRKKDENK
ncbi:MAG: AMP-binding protein [Clostridia bacterium]|nr:AMP-binding protein [Clostridia bacterium]